MASSRPSPSKGRPGFGSALRLAPPGAEVVGACRSTDMRDLNPALRELIAHNGVTEGVVGSPHARAQGHAGTLPLNPPPPDGSPLSPPPNRLPERWYGKGSTSYPSTPRRGRSLSFDKVKSASALERVMAAQMSLPWRPRRAFNLGFCAESLVVWQPISFGCRRRRSMPHDGLRSACRALPVG